MHSIPARHAFRVSVCTILLAGLSACGGGGGSAPVPLVNTSTGNPSASSTQVVAAAPNAANLTAVAHNGGTPDGFGNVAYNVTVGGVAYPFSLATDEEVTPPAGYIASNWGFIMLCQTSPRKATAVFSSPQVLSSATAYTAVPANASDLAALPADTEFFKVTNCDDFGSSPNPTPALLTFNSNGTATRTSESGTATTVFKADLDKYFSTLGLQDTTGTHRWHVYKQTRVGIAQPFYLIVETGRVNGVDNVSMWVQEQF